MGANSWERLLLVFPAATARARAHGALLREGQKKGTAWAVPFGRRASDDEDAYGIRTCLALINASRHGNGHRCARARFD